MISQSTATEDSFHVIVLESVEILLQDGKCARAGVIMCAGLLVIQTESRQA